MDKKTIEKVESSKFVIIDSRSRNLRETSDNYRALLTDTIRNVKQISLTGIRMIPESQGYTLPSTVRTSQPYKALSDTEYVEDYQIDIAPSCNYINASFKTSGIKEVVGTEKVCTKSCTNGLTDYTEEEIDVEKTPWSGKGIDIIAKGGWSIVREQDDNTPDNTIVHTIVHTPSLFQITLEKTVDGEVIVQHVDVVVSERRCPCSTKTYNALKGRKDDYLVLKIPEINGNVESNSSDLSGIFTIVPTFDFDSTTGKYNQDDSTFGELNCSHSLNPRQMLSKLTIEWRDSQDNPAVMPEHVMTFNVTTTETVINF